MNGFSADIVGGGLVNGEHNVFNGFVPVICHSHYVIEEFVDVNLTFHIRNVLHFFV